jgi:1-acyl-sn-glycerol-3-phosphate acyltransferase
LNATSNQFRLLRERRFLPFFGAQALGAFNDNVYKNVLVIVAIYQAAAYTTMEPQLLTNLAGALFILPYVLFSGVAGQLASRIDKATVLKVVKFAEVLVMALAGIGFVLQNITILLAALFLMGVQSTFFAPAKYGLLPEVLHDTELVGGNAMVEMGTFLAILLGTLVAGLLAAYAGVSAIVVTISCVAALGAVVSLAIPKLAPATPSLRVDWRIWVSTWENLKIAYAYRPVFLALLGISWFWFYGTIVLAQLPLLSRDVIGGSEQVVTVMLVLFAFGVGLGSLLCERMSGHKVEIGLVPFGSIGLTLFAVDLYFALPAVPSPVPLTAGEFLATPGAWRILLDLGLIGLFGGFFIVPLYAMVQQRTRREAMSRVIGANSILNALFMVVAAVFGAALLQAGIGIAALLLLTGILNVLVAAYIYRLVPEFLLRFLAWLLVNVVCRLDKHGLDNIPERGPALLVCNHVSFADALVISAACRRPIRFVMDSNIFSVPLIRTVFRGMKAIPIASRNDDPAAYQRAFQTVAQELQSGNLVCIFPEGRLTPDGEIGEFRPGMMRILQETPVPVVPLALSGLWGSMFSRRERAVWRRWPRRIWARLALRTGEPVAAAAVTPLLLRERVVALRGGER